LGHSGKAVPITRLQHEILAVIGPVRTPESYLAGGTVLHFSPTSTRYSRDLDLFHDALEGVAIAFAQDAKLLTAEGFGLETVISQPGFIRSIVSRGGDSTQIDWARDSAWRFMPVTKSDLGGYVLHDIDAATNKILALAGREEARDFVDILYVIDNILALGPLVWAAIAKDPGYSPLSLLEQIRRRGRNRPEDFARLDLVRPIDLVEAKRRWLEALAIAADFVDSRPMGEAGCLYYRESEDRFVRPAAGDLGKQGIVTHFGRAGGVLPRLS
jgi:hypothetical protein